MDIALAGLVNSHPYSDARNLQLLNPAVRFVFVEEDDARATAFLGEHPDALRLDSVQDLIRRRPAAAVVTVPPERVSEVIDPFLNAGIPSMVTKPAAVSAEQLADLDRTVQGRESLLLTTSILRYSSALTTLPKTIRHGRVTASHDILFWQDSASRWQDISGGLVPMIGIHAFELLEVCLGSSMRVIECHSQHLRDTGLSSPDRAFGTVVNDSGASMRFEINGLDPGESYAVEYREGNELVRIALEGGADPFGYKAVVRSLIAMADGAPSPLQWVHTQCVLRAVVAARELSEAPHLS